MFLRSPNIEELSFFFSHELLVSYSGKQISRNKILTSKYNFNLKYMEFQPIFLSILYFKLRYVYNGDSKCFTFLRKVLVIKLGIRVQILFHSGCMDIRSFCESWAYAGYCRHSRYKPYMVINCRRSCGICR